jgi:MFS family permease
MLAAILGSAMVFLDSTVMNLALPAIGRELPHSPAVSVLEGQTYAVSGYLAILAALLVLAGALADYYGRRRIFAIGLTGFGIASVLCGLAPTLELLVLFRLLQGATGALLVPGSLAILTALFEGQARARAFGIWASATSATSLIGPVVGGLLVDTVSWRAAFLINIPLVAIALFATMQAQTGAEATLARADSLKDQGRMEEALARYREFVQGNPNDFEGQRRLGGALLEAGGDVGHVPNGVLDRLGEHRRLVRERSFLSGDD